MKLRNRRSQLPTAPERSPPKARGPRVTHYIYLLLLAAIVGYLLYIAWQRFMFLEAKGQVEVERITLSASRGGTISKLLVTDDQKVDAGKLLARVTAPQECQDEQEPARLNDLRMEASLTANEASILSERLNELRTTLLERQRLRRALEIDTRLDNLTRETRESIESTEEDLARKRVRLGLLQDRADELKRQFDQQPLPPECRPESIMAPSDGRIYRVAHKEAEVVTRAEPILTFIPTSPKVRVEVVLPNEDVDELQIGQTVSITFPDGIESSGIVGAITSMTSNVIRPDWDPEPPPAEHARVIVHPLSSKDAPLWQAYDRMTVTMRARQ